MHTFLKKIFGRSEPAKQIITFDAIPGWITEQESAAKSTLVAGTREPMNAIRQAIAHLQIIINDVAGAEHDPVLHPKLRTIAKNSLPQFVKAMKASLAKELPDENPEEFYTAAAEVVKNCINSAHGQGRYLQAIFPEEMKGVRQGIDAIGRGINTINPLLAAYRKEMADVTAARALFNAIVDLRTDYVKSEEKVRRAHARIAEITGRQAAIDKELDMNPEDPRMQEINQLKAALGNLTGKRDDAARTYSTLSMTASHVFRKAEKIATRQHHPSEIAILNPAMEILSDHEIPDREKLNEALVAACPVTERMINAGEILLKNKEERIIFSDTQQFRVDIDTACSTLHALEENCLQAEKALSAHPLVMKMQSLEREKTQLAAMLAKENLALEELEEWRSKTEKRIPKLSSELAKKIGMMSGDNVQFQDIDQTPS
jgi:hypothetical protein